MTAIFICAQPQREALQNLGKWWTVIFFYLWSWWCRKADPKAEVVKFRDYINAAIKGPAVTPRVEGGRLSMCPPVYAMLRFCAEEMGQDIDRALDLPLDRIRCLMAAHADQHVGVRAWDERTESLWKYAAAQDALKKGANGTW